MPNKEKETDVKPRKDAKQERSKATVSYIIEATARILKNGGKLTTNHIAHVAGVSVGSLYQYFPNKDAVLKKFVDAEVSEVWARFCKSLEDAEATSETIEEMVDKLVDFFIAQYAKQEPVYKFFFTRAFQLGIVEVVVKAENAETQHLVELIKRWHHVNPINDPETTAYMIVQSCLGVLRSTWIREDHPTHEELATEMKRMIKGYLFYQRGN